MVTVFIWLPDSNRHTVFGHSSMFIDSIHDGYVSFYPNNEGKKGGKFLRNVLGAPPRFIDSLEEDIDCLEKDPEYTIEISNLNEDAMEEHWLDIKNNERDFQLLGRNCSAVVGRTLSVGFDRMMEQSFSDALKGLRWLYPSNWRGYRKIVGAELTYWNPRSVLEFALALKRVTE